MFARFANEWGHREPTERKNLYLDSNVFIYASENDDVSDHAS